MSDARLTKLQTMAQRFGENGSVDQATMRKINALAFSLQSDELFVETQLANGIRLGAKTPNFLT